MILNISGRTDIPAYYSEWFHNRLKEGFVDVRNPFNKNLVSRIKFEDVDLFMFCSKNPRPIIKYLTELNKPIIFHITLTPYLKDIEPNVPDKKEIIKDIKEISKIIGIDNTVVRYDPVFISRKYNLEYHKKVFNRLCEQLNGYVKTIIVSFLDDYKNVRNNKKYIKDIPFTEDDYKEIGISFSNSAKINNMKVQTCFEERNLSEYGFNIGECLSHQVAYQLTGKKYSDWKARKCHCVQMVDIGDYNSCMHMCKYCYANYDESKIFENIRKHNPESSLLIGEIQKEDIIKERKK